MYNKDWCIERDLVPSKYKEGNGILNFVLPLDDSNFSELHPNHDPVFEKNVNGHNGL